jgi:phage terminase Nu1 subunit (DNA packaging protein)
MLMAAEKDTGIAGAWCVRTQNSVAEFFAVRRSSVVEWFSCGCPGRGPKGYDLAAIARWRLDRQRATPNGDVADAALSARRRAAEVAILEAKAEAIRVENERLAGRLRHVDEINQRWNVSMLRIRHRLQAFPSEMAMTFPVESRPQNLCDFEDAVYALLREMSEMTPE